MYTDMTGVLLQQWTHNVVFSSMELCIMQYYIRVVFLIFLIGLVRQLICTTLRVIDTDWHLKTVIAKCIARSKLEFDLGFQGAEDSCSLDCRGLMTITRASLCELITE